MTKNLQDEIVNDLSRDFPSITYIEKREYGVIVYADEDTLWEIFEVLYNGIDVEFNMGNDDEAHIIIRT